MHVNKTKFEKNGSQEYHHMTYIGKTEHANLANSNPHEVLVLVCGRDYPSPCIELYIMSTDYL